MADINVQLLDTGDNFILVSADMATEIEYGQLAVSLVNTDYDDMYNMLSDFVKSNRIIRLAMELQNSSKIELIIGTVKPEIINNIIKELYKPMYEYLAKEYLKEDQATIITLLLMADIRSRLTNTRIDLNRPECYIPLIYSDKEIHQHIKDILLKKDSAYIHPIQDKMNGIQLTSSIIITEQGQPYQSYNITDIFDYLILDLQKYLTGKKTVKECECCHKLFIPKYRSSEKYCEFNRKDKYRSCKEYMKRKKTTDFRKARDDARGYNSNIHNESVIKKYGEEFLQQLYDDWTKELSIKYEEYNSKDDLQGFQEWIKETLFTKAVLDQKWKEYQEK